MKLRGFTKLSTKLLAIFLLIVGVTLIGLFAILETRQYFSERRELVANLEELVNIQSQPISAALWEFDTNKVESFLVEVGRLPFVQGTVVIDTTGTIIAQNGDPNTPPKNPDFVAHKRLVFRRGINSEPVGSIRIVAHDSEILRNVWQRQSTNATILIVLLAAISGVTMITTNTFVGRPLRRLQASIERRRRDGVRELVDWDATDELGQVVSAYNEMQVAQEKTEEELRVSRDELEARVEERTKDLSEALTALRNAQSNLVQAEKMAALGGLAAGIAHEIKNPLNFVNNFAQISADMLDEAGALLKKASTDPDLQDKEEIDELFNTISQNLARINEHGQRADSIVNNMLLHSRGDTGKMTSVDLNVLVEENLKLAYHGARAKDKTFNIDIERDFDSDAGSVEVIAQEIGRALLNLFENGLYASHHRLSNEQEKMHRPVLRVSTRDLGKEVEIKVRDNGTGIHRKSLEKIFEPFFTTKPAGKGTGLGLSITHDIVVGRHGGTISVDSKEHEFTEFTLILPRHGSVTEPVAE